MLIFYFAKNCEFGRLPEFLINEAFIYMDVLKTSKISYETYSSLKHTCINFLPPKTPLLYSKTGVYRDIHYFSYFFSKT